MSVQEQLARGNTERERPHGARDARRTLPPEFKELSMQGEQMANIADKFMEATGIKLALFEFNQDLLDNQGRINTYGGFRYIDPGDGESLVYYSYLNLTWRTPDETYYSLAVGVNGDLLDTFEREGLEDHVRNLSIDLFQGKTPTGTKEQISTQRRFERYFDIFDPHSMDETNIPNGLSSREEIERYMELEEMDGIRDLGRNTFRDWAEANIAGFISFVRRELHQEPLIAPAA